MYDISKMTNEKVREFIEMKFAGCVPGTDRWRIIGTVLNACDTESFTGPYRYPRPDSPIPERRRPIEFLLASVLISLRTTLENESKAEDNLLRKCATVEDLYGLTEDELAELIRPAGMAERKAKNIIACLREVGKLDGGLASLRGWGKSRARAYLLDLPGIGPKAADCILTIGLGFPSMVVDVNVFRMGVYIFGLDPEKYSFGDPADVAYIKERFDRALGEDALLCQIVHTMVLLSGKRMGRGHDVRKCNGGLFCLTCNPPPVSLSVNGPKGEVL